jgi:single-strand DNA-binding protein
VHSIIITGRLGREPEMSYSPEGTSWATVSVAEGGDDPNWFDVKCFNKTAEVLNEYGSKGRKVAIQGRMVRESYEKDGETRRVWQLIANRIEFPNRPNGSKE